MGGLDSDAKEELKEWLVKTLEPVSDADPDVLSKYVLALVQADPLKEDLDQLCISKLEEFLGDETQSFVKKLVAALNDGSYRRKTASSSSRKQHRREDGQDGEDSNGTATDPRQSSSKRHRSSNRRDSSDHHQQHPHSRSNRRDSYDHHRSSNRDRDYSGRGGGGGHYYYPPPGEWDPRWGPPGPGGYYPGPEWGPYPPHHGGGVRRGGGRGGGNRRKDGGWKRVEKTAEEPSKFTLFVKNVDPKYLNLAKLVAHFARFGNVINVQMRLHDKSAVVQYDDEEAASRAFQSPIPVCNNRFIQVTRALFDLDQAAERTAAEREKDEEEKEEKAAAAAAQGKQVLEQKRQLLDKQKELMKQKEVLLQNQVAQHEQLLTKMQQMSETGAAPVMAEQQASLQAKLTQLQTELHSIQVSLGTAKPATDELTVLKNELSQLQTQAAAGVVASSAAGPGRGGVAAFGRGGRGGARGRGRGGRGAAGRGRGGAHSTLDLRTTILKIQAIPEQAQDKSVLQQHFGSFGELKQVELDPQDPTAAFVQFADRYGAQSAKSHGTFFGESALQVDWIEPSALPEGVQFA